MRISPVAPLLLALIHLPESALASPEWVGFSCLEYNHLGERKPVNPQICADLYPVQYKRQGCACLMLTPYGVEISNTADDLDCPGMRPDECTQEDLRKETRESQNGDNAGSAE